MSHFIRSARLSKCILPSLFTPGLVSARTMRRWWRRLSFQMSSSNRSLRLRQPPSLSSSAPSRPLTSTTARAWQRWFLRRQPICRLRTGRRMAATWSLLRAVASGKFLRQVARPSHLISATPLAATGATAFLRTANGWPSAAPPRTSRNHTSILSPPRAERRAWSRRTRSPTFTAGPPTAKPSHSLAPTKAGRQHLRYSC